MTDRVPLYPGRVTLTPVSGQANTYDMARADQPTQEGTPLNKANLLSDQVASLIGLTSAAVPNDMFNVLATAGDLHVWRRTKSGVIDYPVSVNPNAYQTGSDAQPAGYTLGEPLSEIIYQQSYVDSGIDIYTSDDVVVNDDGTIQNQQFVDKHTFNMNSSSVATIKQQIQGKFFAIQSSVYYAPETFTVTFYPYVPAPMQEPKVAFTGLQPVTGYPAIPAGTTIEYMGKLGDKTRIVTGSYAGTGTYGSSNPNSLTFGFEPKFWGIYNFLNYDVLYNYPMFNFFPFGNNMSAYMQQTTSFNSGVSSISYSGNSVSWYSNSAKNQLNVSNNTYYYIAIG